MANELESIEEEAKKPGDNNAGNQETILEQKKEEGSADGQAETTIHSFLADRLQEFQNEMNLAIDQFEAYVMQPSDDVKAAFNQRGFYDFIGDRFQLELFNLVGGFRGKPLMEGLVTEVHTAVSFNQHSAANLGLFILNAFRMGIRDACWYLRDNAKSMLDAQWPELLTLAANGSDQFIPALYQFGVPSRAFKPTEFASSLIDASENYKGAMGKEQQELKGEAQADPKADEIEQQAKKDMVDEASKPKDAIAAGGP